MINRIFPKQFDNAYRGSPLALWLFALFLLLRLAMSVNSLINTRTVAMGGDGIPLDSYGAGGAEAVLLLFALLGLSHLAPVVLGIIALIRYRAMIPLTYLLLLMEMAGRRAFIMANPIERIGEASPVGLYINVALLAALAIGFVLSIQTRRKQ